MTFMKHAFLGILILQLYVHAAPSYISKLANIAKVEEIDEKVELKGSPTSKEIEERNKSTDSPRQGRYYNPFGFNYPTVTPQFYPTFDKREEFPNTGLYRRDDQLAQIHRLVQEIANIVRQPPLPPPISYFPVFYPILITTPFNCNCNLNYPSLSRNNERINISNRLPEDDGPSDIQNWNDYFNIPIPIKKHSPRKKDERLNWNKRILDINNNENTNTVGEQGQDLSRKKTFSLVNKPNSEPAPPVEHDFLQPGGTSSRHSQIDGPSEIPNNSGNQGSFNAHQPPRHPQNNVGQELPNPCDAALTICCRQLLFSRL